MTAQPSHWYRRRWEETPGGEQDAWGRSTWLFETDPTGDVLRQLEVYDTGPTLRYDLDHEEDAVGGLTQVPLEPDDWAAFAITRQEFDTAWTRTSDEPFDD
jgi:hypothetical protein